MVRPAGCTNINIMTITAKELWKSKVPSSSFQEAPKLELSSDNEWQLRWQYSTWLTHGGEASQRIVSQSLVVNGVYAFRVTYHEACSSAMVELAYERLIDAGTTQWLTEIKARLAESSRLCTEAAARLRHLMIFFDSHGCYEFLCESFRLAE